MKLHPYGGPITLAALLVLSLTQRATAAPPTLKEAFKHDFLVGVALNPNQFGGSNIIEAKLVEAQFNSISPENVLKWESVHPKPDQYNFEPGDKYVEFGVTNGMAVIGHTLVWHSQTPRWVFQ